MGASPANDNCHCMHILIHHVPDSSGGLSSEIPAHGLCEHCLSSERASTSPSLQSSSCVTSRTLSRRAGTGSLPQASRHQGHAVDHSGFVSGQGVLLVAEKRVRFLGQRDLERRLRRVARCDSVDDVRRGRNIAARARLWLAR